MRKIIVENSQDIAEHKRAEKALQRRFRQLQMIHHLSEAVSRAEVIEEIYEVALDGLQHTLEADRSAVLLFDPDGIMRFKAWRGLSENYRKAVEGHSPWPPDAKNPQPVLIPNAEEEPSLETLRDVILGEDIRALGFIPLVYKGRLLGKFMLYYRTLHQFSQEEIQVAETMASHIAFAIERKRAEEALRESEQRYRTLMTQTPIGVVTCDRAGNITHVNPALLEILGSPSEEATRQFNLLTLPSLVEAGIAADFRRCMEEATQITAEYPYRSYWGKESIVRLHMIPLRDESEAVSGALATVEDVTEQRRLQEQLIQSAKLASIGQLAAGVAHEINNPINGIINYAQLLLNKAEPGSRQARFLEGILREGNRVAHIVHDLLTFARVEKEAHSPAHVADILRATLSLTGQQLKKDGIILEIEEQPGLPKIKCRSQRIQQVFLNLIFNARDALNARYPGSDPNKRLTIRIEQVEREGQPYVRTTFHDRGVGIPAHNLPHLFTPFFTTKRPGEGTGLGLSVSYGIVQDHRGDIQVESVEGEYTIFRVDLPVDNEWELRHGPCTDRR